MNLRGRLGRLSPLRTVAVVGDSMVPTYRAGDWLLVRRTRRVSVGDVIVAPDPRDDRRILIKRITRSVPGGWFVEGDAPAHSTDSRAFGPIRAGDVVGTVVLRYRRGR